MPNNNLLPKENYKKVEIVQELKNEYQVPSFEEFMENYEFDERIVESYEEEAKAQAFQGPKCGPGRSDFKSLYRKIKCDLMGGSKPTCKISCCSDNFDSDKFYAGAIIYAVKGEFEWRNKGGEASGHKARSFYIIIKCTNSWGTAEQGVFNTVFHGHVIKSQIGYNLDNSDDQWNVCCGGFSWIPTNSPSERLRFNSIGLNRHNQRDWNTDGYRILSEPERELVDYCFRQYKIYGRNHIIHIPDWLDSKLSSY